ncbi:MAG: hypothetical protein HY066_12870 [Betaproteobacteria bacterium]|nr:hypothetical protein [Betaproteobacteria bacterium]
MKFHFLSDFTKWILEGVDRDISQLEQRAEGGEFAEYEDYEAAMDYPFLRAKYAAEAILHLLNALVDEQLRNVAEALTDFTFDPGSPKLPSERISRLSFEDLIKAIERGTGLSLSDLGGWKEYQRIRKIVNALKHSAGQRPLRGVLEEGGNISDLSYDVTMDDVKEGIAASLKLVRIIFSALGQCHR